MSKYIEFVLQKPTLVLITLFATTVILGSGLLKLKVDHSIEAIMPQHDQSYIDYQKSKAIYGNVGKLILVSITSDDIRSHTFFIEMDKLVSDYLEYQDFDEAREKQRLLTFEKIIQKEPIRSDKLLTSFNDDPEFQRCLKRKITNKLGKQELLSEKQLQILKKELKKSFELKKQGVLVDIISPITAKDISGEDDTLAGVDLIEIDDNGQRILPATKENFQEFRRKLTRNPSFKKSLYATDDTRDDASERITDFAIYLEIIDNIEENIITQELWEIAESYDTLSVYVMGVPTVNKTINDFMIKDLTNFFPLIILVVLVVFYLNFRSLRGVLLPLSAVILTDIWTMGFMGHMGITITVIGVSLPTLIIAIGSSYSIHILNQYYIDFDQIKRKGREEGLKLSMAHIATTVLLAGVTTFFGFFSLLTSQISAIREWGLFCAIGAVFAVLISTSLIPAVLVLLPHKRNDKKKGDDDAPAKTWVDPLIRLFIRLSLRHYKIVIAITAIVLAVSIMGASKMKVETNAIAYFKENSYIRKSLAHTQIKFNGTYGLIILVDSGETNGILNPEFLKPIDEICKWFVSDINEDLHIGATMGFTDIIKRMHMAMNNDDPDYYKIPDSREEIMDYLEIFAGDDKNSDGRIDDFETFIDPDFRTTMVFAKISEKQGGLLSTSDFKRIAGKSADHITKALPSRYTFKITGEPVIMAALSDYVVKGQLSSLAFCILAVAIMVILLFKNIKAGLCALIPMTVAVTINFGIMGWGNINLDTATALIAAIAIGIGVDDTIHFMNTFRYFRSQQLSVDDAITETLLISGKAITYTSLALVLGFLVMAISNFKPIILLGSLNSITMVTTTIGALVILPAIIKATGISLAESESNGLLWRIFHIGRFFKIESDSTS